jgi:hypothetical protein
MPDYSGYSMRIRYIDIEKNGDGCLGFHTDFEVKVNIREQSQN